MSKLTSTHNVISPEGWHGDLLLCRQHCARLNSWERRFLHGIDRAGANLSPKQLAVLRKIATRLSRGLGRRGC